MNPELLNSIASTLWRAALEGGLLALLVGCVVRSVPALPATTRTALWWLVTLRLVAGLAALPLLVVPMPSMPGPPSALVQTTLAVVGPLPSAIHNAVSSAPTVPALPAERSFAWRDAVRIARPVATSALPGLLALWAGGVLLVIVQQVRTARRIAHAWRAASECRDARVHDWCLAALQSRRVPRIEVRVSHETATPMLLAGPHARILLPESCLELEATQLRMVMAHEAAHLRRHDLSLGAVPALAQCLFWFHPLARWAAEEYAQAREEACDADAMRSCDAKPYDYGELLLAYGIEPARHVPAAACYGSRSASRLRRRILMLGHDRQRSTFERRVALVILSVVAIGALAPVRLVAAGAHSPESAVAKSRSRTAGTATSASATDAVEPGASAPALPRLDAIDRRSTNASERRRSRDRGFEYGCGRLGEHGSGLEMSMSGTFDSKSMTWFKSLAKQNPEGFGWFKLEGDWYVVEDRQAIAEMRRILAVQDEVGQLQGELGERQGKLGEQQSRLGEMQADLGSRQGDLSGKLSQIEALLSQERLSSNRRQELRERRAVTEKLLGELEARQEELEKQQDELSRLQDELGAQQDELGARQDELGTQVDQEMQVLAKDLLKRGLAVRTNHR